VGGLKPEKNGGKTYNGLKKGILVAAERRNLLAQQVNSIKS